MEGRVVVSDDDFDIEELKKIVADDRDGAVVTFTGIVKGENKGKRVSGMEVQRYEGMTKQELSKVRDEALLNFKISDVLIIHRFGELRIGDNIVGIVVSAPCRTDAFDACRYCIDRLKEMVPIWKQEKFQDDGKDEE